jgi:ligand-binding sensor domain-containing protein
MRFGTPFISGASTLLRSSRNWLVACAVSWLWHAEKTQLRVPGQSQASLAPQRDSFTRRWRSVLLLGGLLLPGLARLAGAQGNDLVFAALTPQANGLPVGQVQAILQDRHGFMWFGTQSGLVKYDGQTLIVYTHNPDDPHSLSDNNVLALCEDRHGTLWVGTNIGGLNRFERATGSFTRFQADAAKPGSLGVGAIRSICEDRAGALWISLRRGGLARFERESETFTHFLP